MDRDVTLRIVVGRPPAGLDMGLQLGSGASYETTGTHRCAAEPLEFECTVRAEASNDRDEPSLVGPVVQGPRTARFLYLDVGTFAGQSDTLAGGRIKVPLTGITSQLLDVGPVLVARIAGTRDDGRPAYGTVKSFIGWRPEDPGRHRAGRA